MDVSLVRNGDTFVISYGKLIKTPVVLDDIGGTVRDSNGDPAPKTGSRTVKLVRSVGQNSFADGDATVDGICEVCHTQTSHWRNDGTRCEQTC